MYYCQNYILSALSSTENKRYVYIVLFCLHRMHDTSIYMVLKASIFYPCIYSLSIASMMFN